MQNKNQEEETSFVQIASSHLEISLNGLDNSVEFSAPIISQQYHKQQIKTQF
jgi:hypothetical protein